jgi:hypothetical protein
MSEWGNQFDAVAAIGCFVTLIGIAAVLGVGIAIGKWLL